MRKFADETDRVGEHDRATGKPVDAPQGRVERGEKLIRGIHAGTGHGIEQGRFAGVGVADQGNHRQGAALTRPTRLVALHFDLVEALLQLLDPHREQAAIDFKLGFARAAQADGTATLAFKMGPAAHETGRHVLELGQFDLQLAFMRARALGEDVEDQSGAVDHAALGQLLEVALLYRRQGVIDEDEVGIERNPECLQLLGLAGADEIARIRAIETGGQAADHGRARRTSQFREFLQQGRIMLSGCLCLQQQGTLAFFRSIKQCDLLGFVGVADDCIIRAGDAHVATWHDRRDGMLVDHLADRVAQQHDKLVEGLDRALQLDAIDQVDRYRHAFAPECIEKRILQRLSFGHYYSPVTRPEPEKKHPATVPGPNGQSVCLVGVPV